VTRCVFGRPKCASGAGSTAYACFTVHQPHGLLPLESAGASVASMAVAGGSARQRRRRALVDRYGERIEFAARKPLPGAALVVGEPQRHDHVAVRDGLAGEDLSRPSTIETRAAICFCSRPRWSTNAIVDSTIAATESAADTMALQV
jgi:hypothetical protein